MTLTTTNINIKYGQIKSLDDFLSLNPMTQYQLASLLHVSVEAVSSWSKGTRNITETTVIHLNRLHVLLHIEVEKIPARGKNI